MKAKSKCSIWEREQEKMELALLNSMFQFSLHLSCPIDQNRIQSPKIRVHSYEREKQISRRQKRWTDQYSLLRSKGFFKTAKEIQKTEMKNAFKQLCKFLLVVP